MGNILKKDASVVQYEKDVQNLKNQINAKERRFDELAKDMNYAQMFDDADEITLIRSEKDNVLTDLANLKTQLEELKANEKV